MSGMCPPMIPLSNARMVRGSLMAEGAWSERLLSPRSHRWG